MLKKTTNIFSAVASIEQDVHAANTASKARLNGESMNAALNVVFERSHGNREIERSASMARAADEANTTEAFNGRVGLQDTASRLAAAHYDKAHVSSRKCDETAAKAAVLDDKTKRVVAQLQEIKKSGAEMTEPSMRMGRRPAANLDYKPPMLVPVPAGMAA